ncbi:Anhydromuropeptide permease [Methylobacterium bullatum]|uniref:Anhydromuropeptide permease n=3 Tax=Methylobacterium bullatum TaxID=570505 RepID=A0AAV4Z6G9_9HYPH|nr:Anhydromuropeptide permease [Methylobacterium bullatum]
MMRSGATDGPPAMANKASRSAFLMIAGLYVSQGLPIGFAFEALPILLRQAGIGLDTIALTPIVALPWILKFLWSPLVDNTWTKRLGRRRSWMIPTQAVLVISLVGLAFVPLGISNMPITAALLLLGSCAGATQNIVTDGFAAEALPHEALGVANALQIGGIVAGAMLGGGGSLILHDLWGVQAALLVLAAVALLSLLPVLSWRESIRPADRTRRKARLPTIIRRRGFGPILLLSLCYGVANAGGFGLSKLVLLEKGWMVSQIGAIAVLSSATVMLIGSPLAAFAIRRFGLWHTMLAGLFVALAPLIAWWWAASGPASPSWVLAGAATVLLGTAAGLISVAASTLAMRFGAQGNQAGTDVAVLQSANVLGEMMIASTAMWLASSMGYANALIGATAATAVVFAIVLWCRESVPSVVLEGAK